MSSEGLPQIVRDLPRLWRDLGRTRQFLAIGIVAVILVGLIMASVFLRQTPYTALYSNLSEQDAAAVVGKLKELDTPFTIENGGRTIKVPSATAPELRLQLVGQGLPSGSAGMVGMEVFDKTNLGVTDFAQKLNHQRALEGELTRTVSRLAPVEQARVHLVMPQERLFSAQQRDATSSVVLKLKPGAKLTDEQVGSVKALVSGSVEGLKPEHVAVVDINGNTLGASDAPTAAYDKQVAARLDVQRQRETELERKIQGLLDRVVGPNRAVVRATVALGWDQVEQKIETFSPGAAAPQVRSQHEIKEKVTGGGADAAGGTPGAQPNLDGPPTYQGANGAQAGPNSTYDRSDLTTNHELSSDRQSIVRAVGEVKQIGLAISMDQAAPAAQVEQITALVTAAAGLQPQRGDQVSVVSLPLETSLGAAPSMDMQMREWYELGVKLLGVVLALGGLVVLFRYLSRTTRPKMVVVHALPAASGAPALPGGRRGVPALPGAEDSSATGALMPPEDDELSRWHSQMARLETLETAKQARMQVESAERQAETAERQRQRDDVAQMARAKPEILAALLSSWLEEGREQRGVARSRA